MLIRTSLRIKENLKKRAEQKALQENVTLQEILNNALEHYLEHDAGVQAKKIIFKTHDLGAPIDDLKREDFYS
jgi:hypothetical protein